jgi:hypothetical protein
MKKKIYSRDADNFSYFSAALEQSFGNFEKNIGARRIDE